MYCSRCRSGTEANFKFCIKCGAPRRLFVASLELPKRFGGFRRSLGVGFVLILILTILAILFLGRSDLRSVKQGHRSGLDYAEWIVLHKIPMETLGNVLGAPLRIITLSADRKIHWFQIQDGLLGIESPAQIIHFRPNSSRLLNDLPARYGPPSARYVVNDEVINNYSTASQLALTTLAPSSQEKAIKEVILWRIETF